MHCGCLCLLPDPQRQRLPQKSALKLGWASDLVRLYLPPIDLKQSGKGPGSQWPSFSHSKISHHSSSRKGLADSHPFQLPPFLGRCFSRLRLLPIRRAIILVIIGPDPREATLSLICRVHCGRFASSSPLEINTPFYSSVAFAFAKDESHIFFMFSL